MLKPIIMVRPVIALTALLGLPAAAGAQTCVLSFTIEVTQGVGLIRPGTHLPGNAEYTTTGRSFRQEGGSTAHLAAGSMTIGDDITGPIWTLIATSRAHAADLIGVYAHDIEGLSFAGLDYEGPMALTLFGEPGSRPTPEPPVTQMEWDDMNLRRSFTLHAEGDMLAGDVLELTVQCS